MTPDERQLLSGLFDRMTGASNQPRDREAEAFIADRVRSQPYAPYLLAQTVIVQEQALRAAADKLQQLEAQAQQQPAEETSFLGSIGKSIFGAGPAQPPTPSRSSVPSAGGYGAAPGGPWNQGQQPNYAQQQNYAPQPGGFGGAGVAPQSGGFLKGALGAAAGVAGGVLLADSLRGLFGGHNNPFGIASGGMGMGGMGGGYGQPGETIVNNYYEGSNPGADQGGVSPADDAQQDFLQDQSDDFASDSGFDSGGDDSTDV